MKRSPTAAADLSGRHTPAPRIAPRRFVDGPRGPEFITQPDFARLGLGDPEARN